MTKSSLPKSVRKYIRRQKALIRQKYIDPKEIEQKIKELTKQFFNKQ